MFLPSLLRPLPGQHPASGLLEEPRPVTTVAETEFVAEDLARELHERSRWARTVWVRARSDGSDRLPAAIDAGLKRAGGHGLETWDGVVVVEMDGSPDAATRRFLSDLAATAEAGSFALVTSGRAGPRSRSGLTAAVSRDIEDAAEAWGRGPVSAAFESARRPKAVTDSVSTRLVSRLGRSQRDILELAVRAGYWHSQLGTGESDFPLRPWMIPLEEGWWWVRPAWRASLDRALARTPLRVGAGPSVCEEPPATLSVRMLGPVDVTFDGAPVDGWNGRVGINVLRYLLLTNGRRCPRDQLLDQFWPDADPAAARNRLQVALSGVRRAFRAVTDEPVISFDDGMYRIGVRVETDIDQFDRHVASARTHERNGDVEAAIRSYGEAARLYRGDLAPDAPYDQWTLLPRESYRIKIIDVLDRLAVLRMQRDDLDEAIDVGHRILERDACREDIHRMLMECYRRQGRAHQAFRQYEYCERALRAELGLQPCPETVRLYREMRTSERG
ncbi:MAG: hypothetical protein OEX04_13760 [Acidimicrobiia bacterium]|nr:hypothetical protein [Acidimicrobiia bacterium]MDH4308536.1 hypothetical protein [Acidimicrobiia bacterium]MDH5292364.1 hypothetical protein [Acidimicrobiia bacterium]